MSSSSLDLFRRWARDRIHGWCFGIVKPRPVSLNARIVLAFIVALERTHAFFRWLQQTQYRPPRRSAGRYPGGFRIISRVGAAARFVLALSTRR